MADRQWFVPGVGQIHEEGEEEYFLSGGGEIAEDQAVAAAGRIMSSLAGSGGLAGKGGIAGAGGGLAG